MTTKKKSTHAAADADGREQVIKDEADAQEVFEASGDDKATEKVGEVAEDAATGNSELDALKARVEAVAAKFQEMVDTDEHVTCEKVRALVVELKHTTEPQ